MSESTVLDTRTHEKQIKALSQTNPQFNTTLTNWTNKYNFTNPIDALTHRAALISYCQKITSVESPFKLINAQSNTIPNPFEYINFPLNESESQCTNTNSSVHHTYQSLPAEQRLGSGEFYTPEWVAHLLSKWVTNETTRSVNSIIDPSVGTGRLLTAFDPDKIQNVTGVEIKPTPAIIGSIALQSHGFTQHNSTIHLQDFFDMKPDTLFDGSVANPPYIRHENITNKSHVRSHLPEQYQESGHTPISNRADLYSYFLTKTTQHLHEGANIAWLIPSKWLIAEYGPSIKQFLLDHYDVRGIVTMNDVLFDDALVDTVLLFATKESNTEKKTSGTSFISFKERIAHDTLFELFDKTVTEPEAIQSQSTSQIVFPQESLHDMVDDNWSQYLSSPPVALALRNSKHTTSLDSFVSIDYGIKTGLNDFFFVSQTVVDEYGIEPCFLKPIIPSIRDTIGYESGQNESETYILSIEANVDGVQLPNNGAESVNMLHSLGYGGIVSYIEENRPEPIPPSTKGKRAWFVRESVMPSPIGFPLALDTDHRVLMLDDSVLVSNRFASVTPKYGYDKEVLHAVLNSWLVSLEIETQGRVTGGGAINFACSDIRKMNIVDINDISEKNKDKLRMLSRKLRQSGAETEQTRKKITTVLLESVIDVDITTDIIEQTVVALMNRRRKQEYTIPTVDVDFSITNRNTQSKIQNW